MKLDQNKEAQEEGGQKNCLPRLTYKIKEAASVLGLSANSVRRLIAANMLKSIRSLRHTLIPVSEINQWVKNQTQNKGA